MKPEVSVIIPAYNEEEYVKRTLVSLREQEGNVSYEIIVCDNNSTDNTRRIAKEYADEVVSEEEQGSAYARNTGFEHSQGKYLIFGDADTIYPPNFIKKMHEAFKKEEYAAFTPAIRFTGSNGLKKITNNVINKSLRIIEGIREKHGVLGLSGCCLCTSRKVFKRLNKFEAQNEIPEDIKYSIKIRKIGRLKYFPNIEVETSDRHLYSTGLKDFKIGVKVAIDSVKSITTG